MELSLWMQEIFGRYVIILINQVECLS